MMKYKQFKKIIAILLTCVIALGTVLADSTVSASGPITVSNSTCFVRNAISGKYLTTISNGIATYVVQQSFTGSLNQQWTITQLSNGAYTFSPRSNLGSQLTLTAGDVNGTAVQTFNANQSPVYQQWLFYKNPNGSLRIVPIISTTRVMRSQNQSTAENATMEIWTFNHPDGNESQHWDLIPAVTANSGGFFNKNARILYDSTNTKSALTLFSSYSNAVSGIRSKFSINFSTTYPSQTATLNGGNCVRPVTEHCLNSAGCGGGTNDTLCNSSHLRAASRLNSLLTLSDTYTLRVVGHRLCRYDSSRSTPHYSVGGVGNLNGKNTIIRAFSTTTSADLSYLIQHELTHNLGASDTDNTCFGFACVLNGTQGTLGVWCNDCASDIRKNR